MSGKLVVLTGAHKIVSTVITPDSRTLGISYYPSISDILKSRGMPGHWESCPYFDDLLMHHEMERDSAILSLLEESRTTVLIEQWHIGNMAWAKARSSETAPEYEEKMRHLLGRFEGIDSEIWYISTDLEKIVSVEFRVLYQRYLEELSALIKRFELPIETLDGDAPPDFIRRRITYLLHEG